jgi:hypothetical protein
MQIFQALGTLIESRWRHENYSEQIFPELAAQALTESKLPAQVDPWEIIRWVQHADSLPDQKDLEGRFGDPPITLYAGPRFYVDVYFWLDWVRKKGMRWASKALTTITFFFEFLLRGKSIEEIRQLIKTGEFQRLATLDDKLDTLAEELQNSPLFKTMPKG